MHNHRVQHAARFAPALVLIGALLAGCAGFGRGTPPVASTAAPAPTEAAAATTALAAEATTAPAAEATTAPAASGDEAIKEGIQQTLDVYAKAYNDNDPDLLKQAADQTNLPFRRFIQTRFDTYQQSIFAGQGQFAFTVKSVKQRDLGFVEAQVEQERSGYVTDWTFRQVDGRWLMSEPTEKQIGKKVTTEGDGFKFVTYPWADTDDVNQTVIKLMEQARAKVKERLGKVPDTKAEVLIKPIFGVGKPESPNALAYYDSSLRSGDRMVIFAPHSYVFQGYDPSVGWEAELESTLVHEYTHLVNNRSFTPIARMNTWMVEGLAEYVSDSPRTSAVSAAIQQDHIIPIIDTSGQVNKQDLEHLTILNNPSDISLAYGFAYSLVAYINEKYGGMDGFWKVVNAYDKSQNFDKALQESFGVTYEQFDKDWRAWLKTKY